MAGTKALPEIDPRALRMKNLWQHVDKNDIRAALHEKCIPNESTMVEPHTYFDRIGKITYTYDQHDLGALLNKR